MSKQKLSRSERLWAQIAELKEAAKEAERSERDGRRQTVQRAAVRAGLEDLGLSFDELLAEFSKIAKRHGGTAVPAKQEPDGQDAKETVSGAAGYAL